MGADIEVVVITEVVVIIDTKPLCCFFSFAPLCVEELASIVYWTNRVLSGSTFSLVYRSLLPTTRVPTGGGPVVQRGWVGFLVLLYYCSHHHGFDLGHNGCSHGIFGQKWLKSFAQHFSSDYVLMWGGKDIDVPHLHMEDLLPDAPSS